MGALSKQGVTVYDGEERGGGKLKAFVSGTKGREKVRQNGGMNKEKGGGEERRKRRRHPLGGKRGGSKTFTLLMKTQRHHSGRTRQRRGR